MTHYSFTVTRAPGGVVVALQGALDVSGSVHIGALLGDLIDDQGNLSVVVDLHEVTGVDPAALGVFAVAARLVERHGGTLSVVGPDLQGMAASLAPVAGGEAHRHLVEFYENDAALASLVRSYLEPGLRADEAAIVVATNRHRQLFESALSKAGVDVDGARAARRYLDVDAEETLSEFMVGGAPDPARFQAAIGRLIARAAGPGRDVSIYGEMVAVLWAEGNVVGAVELEDLWNELARSEPFSLLCAYPVTTFDSPATNGLFRTICAQHTLLERNAD